MTSAHILWQLPTQLKITNVHIKTAGASYLYRTPQTITFSGSNDGNEWTQLAYGTNYKINSSQNITFNIENATPFSYLKWDFENPNGKDSNAGIGLQEITIFGTEIEKQFYPPDYTTLQCP